MTIDDAIADLKMNPGDMPCAFALWLPEDVKTAADEMDVKLSEDEVTNILESVHHKQDCNIGINWQVLRTNIAMR